MATQRIASGDKIEASPLLGGSKLSKPPTANSTINLEKLDKARFSEMKEVEGENSSLRIIVYVLIVIVVGVGLALLVRQLISNQQTTQSNTDQTPVSTPVVKTNSALEISTVGISDNLATNAAKSNDDYMDSTIATLGDASVDMSTASLDKIKYTNYQTFSRLIFDLSTTEAKLPKVNFAYDASKLSLSVEIVDIENINTNLKQDLDVNSLVKEIRYDQVNMKYIIFLTEKFKYRVVADKDNLIIDFKTEKEIAKSTDTTDTEPTPTPVTPTPTTSDSGKPAAPHYENSFSQDQQYVSSSVATNSITLNNYYVWDEGSFFEFSWAEEGKLGDAAVPNAKAYLEVKDNVNYIVIEIENLKGANLADGLTAAQLESKGVIKSMAGANYVALTRDSFDTTTGKAVYRIELKKKANFQLLDQVTYDEKTQILSIQIKD